MGRFFGDKVEQAVQEGDADACCLLARVMPLSFQESFNTVLDKAEQGEPFYQMIIGNSYYWWDFPEIQGKAWEDFVSYDAVQNYLRENHVKCEDWPWKSLAAASPAASTWPTTTRIEKRG